MRDAFFQSSNESMTSFNHPIIQSPNHQMLYSPRNRRFPGDHAKWVRRPHGHATVSGERALRRIKGSDPIFLLSSRASGKKWGLTPLSATNVTVFLGTWEDASGRCDPQVRTPGHRGRPFPSTASLAGLGGTGATDAGGGRSCLNQHSPSTASLSASCRSATSTTVPC